MIKVSFKLLAVFLVLVLCLVLYALWDNNRITTAEQAVVIEELPEQLEGFIILQVSDLHEKMFGSNQKRLVDVINAAEYDAIVFTGDMLDSTESKNEASFYSLLEGIDNKQNAWFVPGNTDPYPYQFTPEIEKSAFIKGMEDRGVKLLESLDTVEIDDATVYFVNFELSIIKRPEHVGSNEGTVTPPYESNERYLAYQQQLWEEMKVLDASEEANTIIALNHYPVADPRIEHIQNSSKRVWRNYDLIMAGHYHGGQIRVPFLGAIFVPEPWYNNALFPPEDRVKGLWEHKQAQQYVSAGLGSSDAIPFIRFRLFNPPEINIIKLES
ncbi:hypothetical protein SAMN05216238_10358 [Lentibacillus persicus]|uniref:Calcineurin-like phosphoesterase domain-containing protein n=1 Tax=Lentibacillus persicus TaxID=640948 RepID=A0A1I1UAH1_9BACI|nr:metallophosphoesterase [Lentibacillus persicus]SFD66568.1 hypothetical protein SAMN05216238_10358 [Lentibacillus persicus]